MDDESSKMLSLAMEGLRYRRTEQLLQYLSVPNNPITEELREVLIELLSASESYPHGYKLQLVKRPDAEISFIDLSKSDRHETLIITLMEENGAMIAGGYDGAVDCTVNILDRAKSEGLNTFGGTSRRTVQNIWSKAKRRWEMSYPVKGFDASGNIIRDQQNNYYKILSKPWKNGQYTVESVGQHFFNHRGYRLDWPNTEHLHLFIKSIDEGNYQKK